MTKRETEQARRMMDCNCSRGGSAMFCECNEAKATEAPIARVDHAIAANARPTQIEEEARLALLAQRRESGYYTYAQFAARRAARQTLEQVTRAETEHARRVKTTEAHIARVDRAISANALRARVANRVWRTGEPVPATLEQVTLAAGEAWRIPRMATLRRELGRGTVAAGHEALAVSLRAMIQAPTLDALLSDVVAR